MSRVITGIQATGIPHLGNILGAILPAIDLSLKESLLFFIADLHSLTQIRDKDLLKKNTYELAAASLSLGLDIEKVIFYRQSDVPQVNELTWYLSSFFSYNRLKLSHAFKDKADRLEEVNVSLFTYPMLMAADILLYNAHKVPVGKDQLQHIEITRDIAERFNNKMGETFILPEALLKQESTHCQLVVGIDGEKMSKSRNNFIDIFSPEKELKAQIMSIKTDNQPIEAIKEPESNIIFKIFRTVASLDQINEMREAFKKGGYGYFKAKMFLFEVIWDRFSKERKEFKQLIKDPLYLDDILGKGAEKAREIASITLNEVRSKLGFSSHIINKH